MKKVILFVGSRCGACHQLKAKIQAFDGKYTEYVYDDVDAPNFDEICDKCIEYGVMNVPTLVIVDEKGEVEYNKSGYNPKEDYALLLSNALKNG